MAISANAVVVQVSVQGVRERDDGRFRRRVDREDRHRLRAGDRREVDDPPLRRPQVRERRLRHEQEAAEIDRELAVDVLELSVLDPPGDADPRRVDEHVQAALARDVLLDDAGAVVRVGDVGCDRVCAELGRRRLDLLRGPRGERHAVAFFAKHPRDREPDSRGASGDKCRSQRVSTISKS